MWRYQPLSNMQKRKLEALRVAGLATLLAVAVILLVRYVT